MKSWIKSFYSFIFFYLIGTPVYSTGLEEVSIFKIILQLMFYLGIFIGVILLSIYGTRFIAKSYKRVVSSKYMDLIDVLNIPGGSKIAIININEKIYIISINNNSTTVIDKLSKDDFDISVENFDKYLDRHFERWNNTLKSNKILGKIYSKKDKEDFSDEEKD
ncbi:MAG: hypothetical protein GX300_04885 [Tissierellia bacterium]|nr:hypothetical protein [Tissierellia bacterium]